MIKDKQITDSDLCLADAWYWAYYNNIKLQADHFRLEDHEYLVEPMQSRAHKIVSVKGAQMGFTDENVLKTFHGLIHGYFPLGVLYLFPTDDDVSEFSKGRFNPLIQNNPYHIGRFVTNTNATNIKEVNKSWLYLHGARSTQKIGDLVKESGKLRSRAVDKIVFDEVDLMDPDMVQKALERFSHSDVKEETYLSTPTIPDFGIDKLYNESDMRVWMIKCPGCGRDCCLELDFPECVQFKNAVAYRACKKCGHELHPSDGQWVSRFPSVKDFEGYWISQLNSMYIDPGLILRLYENPPNGNLQEVYNSKLAMAYIAAENRLTPNDVYACCGTDVLAMKDNGPCAMGVDVGKTLHVLIGKKPQGTGRKKIVWMGEVKEFDDLIELGHRYGVVQGAIDYEPETRKAREFQKKAGFAVYLIDEMDKVRQVEMVDELVQVKKVSRTEICDTTANSIRKAMYILPRRCSTVDEYAKQLSNMAKVLEVDEKRGTNIYRYRKLGLDHYFHATNFFEIASQTIPEAMDDRMRDMMSSLGIRKESYHPLTFGLS